MLKSYKYRIYPTLSQKKLIEKTFDCCRLVYNLALETKIRVYNDCHKSLSYIDLGNQLPELKSDNPWLKEVDSQALQASIRNMDLAYINFYKGLGFPRFKKKLSKQSFQCPRNNRKIDFEKSLLTIPKIPNIPIVISRRFEGRIKMVTISKTASGKYFASILVDNGTELPLKANVNEFTAIGVDLNLKDLIVTSEGVRVSNPKYLRNSIDRLRVLQRRASKKVKGSQNRKKANLKVAIQHEKISNQRTDFLQKLSSKLVYDSQVTTFCFEKLRVANMVKNHNLAKSISDASWSRFTEMVKYKCNWTGKNFIQIGAFEPSSKTCSDCGNINNELALKDREWTCKECGVIHDRDINAALNIKAMGLKQSGTGSSVEPLEMLPIGKSMKKERTPTNKQ